MLIIRMYGQTHCFDLDPTNWDVYILVGLTIKVIETPYWEHMTATCILIL